VRVGRSDRSGTASTDGLLTAEFKDMATTRFKDRVALVTGAGSGIGRASAIAFGEAGAQVVVADIDVEHAIDTVRTITNTGGVATFLKADVSSSVDVRSLIEEVARAHGRLDFAHNNAGIEGELAKTADCSEENWDKVIAINLKSIWLCLKYEIPQMVRQARGVIVNTSSVYGLIGCERGMPAYAASKHGVIGLTKTAALEYAAAGIRVNAVCPGAVNTAFRTRLVEKSNERCKDSERYPLGRIAEPHEVADAVMWLCSDEASFITGTTVVIDGGLCVR
jgi:NAD(P)-dependent dehydrogenase (short-subunit alcohol dehydrogenase family)